MTRTVTVTLTRSKRLALRAPEALVVTPTAPVEIERPMTRAEAAEWLSISAGELSRLTVAGLVPHHRLGPQTTRYLKSELLDWLRSQKDAA